jgi:hypothetical protein
MLEHFRGDGANGEPKFFGELSEFFLFEMFTLVLLDEFLDSYFNILLFDSQNLHFICIFESFSKVIACTC